MTTLIYRHKSHERRVRERGWHGTKIGLYALTVCVCKYLWCGLGHFFSLLLVLHKLLFYYMSICPLICIAEYMSHKIINETAAAPTTVRRKRVNEKKNRKKWNQFDASVSFSLRVTQNKSSVPMPSSNPIYTRHFWPHRDPIKKSCSPTVVMRNIVKLNKLKK